MEACRACLATDTALNRFDEAFVIGYNLLTNLNVALLDAMPQYVCQTCSQAVKHYTEFREQCITTETSLREIILQGLKSEDDKPLSQLKTEGVRVKQEIKEEHDSFDFDEAYVDDDFLVNVQVKNEKKEVTKPEKRKYKKRKTKTTKVEKSKSPKKDKTEKAELELKVLSCGLCKETYTDKKQFSDHIESHKKDMKCMMCSEIFKSWPALVGHRFTHLSKNEFICHMCKKTFLIHADAIVNMEYHYMNKHFDGEKTRVACKECNKTYPTPYRLRKHEITYHPKKQNVFICDHCNKPCINKQYLRTHLRKHSEDRSYVCELCGFASKHSGGLRDHKVRKHAPAKVKCKECERWFATAADKDRHACNVQPKICPVCGVAILVQKAFNRHLVSHSSVKKYKCSRCPAAYKNKMSLVAHNNRHDGIRPCSAPTAP
ncbi:zinc-finger associated domain (zf-AD) domain-containing protein [Phthorimaea operculella]|nr:zinc-finger associated domain (zf-AD) domain-containing protein [Phthorimaea operculella]